MHMRSTLVPAFHGKPVHDLLRQRPIHAEKRESVRLSFLWDRTLGAALALALLSAGPALARDNAPTTSTTCTCLCMSANHNLEMEALEVQSQGFSCSVFNNRYCSVTDPVFDVPVSGTTGFCEATVSQGGAASAPLFDGGLQTPDTAIQRQ
jgi:hypothetical protein